MVYRIGSDEFVWVVADSVQQAIVCYLRSEIGPLDLETALAALETPLIEVPEEQLARLSFHSDDGEPDCTMAERLAFEQAQGFETPRIFATESF